MGTEAALGVTRMPGLYRCLRGTKVGQEGTRGDVGLSNLWVTHQHWEMPCPGWTSPAMGKPVQETRVRWDGMGWGSTGKGSVCPICPLHWGQDRSPPSGHFRREMQGAVSTGWGCWSSLAWGHIWSSVLEAVMVHGARAATTQDLGVV